jgi:hypothetical protein
LRRGGRVGGGRWHHAAVERRVQVRRRGIDVLVDAVWAYIEIGLIAVAQDFHRPRGGVGEFQARTGLDRADLDPRQGGGEAGDRRPVVRGVRRVRRMGGRRSGRGHDSEDRAEDGDGAK